MNAEWIELHELARQARKDCSWSELEWNENWARKDWLEWMIEQLVGYPFPDSWN